MSYEFARINLSLTNYTESVKWCYLSKTDWSINRCQTVYRAYCQYKKFSSVMPLFVGQFRDAMTDIIGYFDQGNMVAFSLIRKFDEHNALCEQFAWNYHNPSLRLGIETLKTECAIYKKHGFEYLYLDQAHVYKQDLDGFELLGPVT